MHDEEDNKTFSLGNFVKHVGVPEAIVIISVGMWIATSFATGLITFGVLIIVYRLVLWLFSWP